MKKFIQSYIQRLQYYSHDWTKFIQGAILKTCLFFVYFLGIGLTCLLMPLFGKGLLHSFKIKKGQQKTYWVNARGYGHDRPEQFHKQV